MLAIGLILIACSNDGLGMPGGNRAPEVTLEVDRATGDAPLTVNFDSNAQDADDDELVFIWDAGDGSTVEGESSFSHTYDVPGTYTATVTVSDGDDTSTDSVEIVVGGVALDPLKVTLAASPTAGSVPLVVTFNANTISRRSTRQSNVLTYTFDFGDGETTALTGSDNLTIDHTYQAPGVYDAQVIVRDEDGNLARSSTVITANPPTPPQQGPQAILNASTDQGNAPLTVTFDASGSQDSDGQITSYDWDFGDGTSAFGEQVTHTFSQDGTYIVILTVSNDEGEMATARQTITVGTSSNEPPQAAFSATPETGTAPLAVVFDAASSSDVDGIIQAYTWDFGDGDISSGQVVNHTFTSSGTFTVTLLVVDNRGAADVTSTIINVRP
jgi:PKD repeat protein